MRKRVRREAFGLLAQSTPRPMPREAARRKPVIVRKALAPMWCSSSPLPMSSAKRAATDAGEGSSMGATNPSVVV